MRLSVSNFSTYNASHIPTNRTSNTNTRMGMPKEG